MHRVCTGDILYRSYRAHGLQFLYKRIGGGLNPPHILIKESQVIIHKTDKPDLVFDVAYNHCLPRIPRLPEVTQATK